MFLGEMTTLSSVRKCPHAPLFYEMKVEVFSSEMAWLLKLALPCSRERWGGRGGNPFGKDLMLWKPH